MRYLNMIDPHFDPYQDLLDTIHNVAQQAQVIEKLVECNNNLAKENQQLLVLYKQLRQRLDRLEYAYDIEQTTTNNRPRR